MLEIRELIFGVVADLLYLILSVGVFYLIAYIRKNIDQKKLDIALELIEMSVLYAQQKGWNLEGQKRFEMALEFAVSALNSKGIQISQQEIENLIESVLKRLKMEYGDAWKGNESE